MHRNPERPKNVNVEFYVLVDGKAQPIAQVFAIFSRLTIAETSAYLSFPVSLIDNTSFIIHVCDKLICKTFYSFHMF